MIRLDIQPYCEQCCDFDPDVTKPVRNAIYSDDMSKGPFPEQIVLQTDTIVRCKNAKRCEHIKRYLEQQSRGDKT